MELTQTQLDAMLGPAPVKQPVPKMDAKQAPAALSASGSLMSMITGWSKKTGSALLGEFDTAKEDLSKNAEVQAGGGSGVQKLASEVKTGLHVGGDIARGAFAPLTGAIGQIVEAQSDDPGTQKAAKNPLISAILDKNNAIHSKMDEWAKAHPEASRSLGDVFDIAGLAGGIEGAEGAITKTARTAEGMGANVEKVLSDRAATARKAKIQADVMPRMNTKVAEEAHSSGRVSDPQGIIRGKINVEPDNFSKKATEAVASLDKYDPGATYTQKVNTVKEGISETADKLVKDIGDNNHPYTFKELQSKLKGVEIPETIKTGTPELQKKGRRIVSKFMEIAQKNGGDISVLLKSRKEFDAYVEKEYPKVFDDPDSIGIHQLIKNVRNSGNDFIESNLPDGFGYKESLQKQTSLYDALDNLSEKAAKGGENSKFEGDIGTTRLQRFKRDHPTATKVVAGGLGYEGLKHLGIVP